MSERSPLLEPARDASKDTEDSTESTPLLAGSSSEPQYSGEPHDADAHSVRSHRSAASSAGSRKGGRRWASIIAIALLGAVLLSIIALAFVVPSAVEEYAKQGAVFEPTNLSLESITTDGVRARVQANFRLDASRVHDDNVRRIGKATTWVVRKLGTEATKVKVYLPEYDYIMLGTAVVPPLEINIMDGQNTAVDFVAELSPGDAEGIRTIANEWLDGRLDKLRIQGKADIELKSGFIPLGTHSVSESLIFEGQYLYRSFASLYFGEKSFF
jgi:hypothetical protein